MNLSNTKGKYKKRKGLWIDEVYKLCYNVKTTEIHKMQQKIMEDFFTQSIIQSQNLLCESYHFLLV